MNLVFSGHRAGFHTFMIGTLALALINPSYFLWLGLIGGIYYAIRLYYKIIGE